MQATNQIGSQTTNQTKPPPNTPGSWQARYDELNKKYNMLLAGAVTFAAFTIYMVCQTHDWIGCPDEPAERWYPLDRFAPGTGRRFDERIEMLLSFVANCQSKLLI